MAFCKVNQPLRNDTQECALGQPVPQVQSLRENLGRCLEQFSPPMVWDFTPEQTWNPAELTDHLRKDAWPIPERHNLQYCGRAWGRPMPMLKERRASQDLRTCGQTVRISGSADTQMDTVKVFGSEDIQTLDKSEIQPSTPRVVPAVKKKQWKHRSIHLLNQLEAHPEGEQEEEIWPEGRYIKASPKEVIPTKEAPLSNKLPGK